MRQLIFKIYPKYLLFILSLFSLDSCDIRNDYKSYTNSGLFRLIDNKKSNVDFINDLDYTGQYNPYSYHNLFNGAGVGLGDVNNDGLIDIYFCGNLVDNRLYLNKGNLKFEDITEKAGVACANEWSAGVSMVDINGDGWLDIYVCQSGIISSQNNRYAELFTKYNELFINNGDLTFTEMAEEYGISSVGLSTHAAFFDYDKDGDLDMYLLNNALRSASGVGKSGEQRYIRDPDGGNKFFRNDNGHFSDVSEELGIYGSSIGFGLGVSIGDINHDGWHDIYVSNDFFEKDYLYINNQGKTFTEEMENYIRELSMGSMGSDIADINNDGYLDIITTEMTPEPEERLKTKALFESWIEYQRKINQGYYHQFARNVLQLNNRNNTFSEIGRLAGVYATDWSWGALIFDMDNDGWKDIFVANGIFKDLLDQDYLNLYSDPGVFKNMIRDRRTAILDMIEAMPSVPVPNYAFRNNKNLMFTNHIENWGFKTPSFSNGAAYGDLDNDGDLDLVINNLNMPSFIYQNLTSEVLSKSYITFVLKGDKQNSKAIGSRITVFCDRDMFYQEVIPMRGFESTSEDRLIFGLGDHQQIDSVWIEWPDDRYSILYDIDANQQIQVNIKDASNGRLPYAVNTKPENPFFQDLSDRGILKFIHQENNFNDFSLNPLLFHMISNEGPKMAVGDINDDGREDVIIGGSKGKAAEIFLQETNDTFKNMHNEAIHQDSISEDTDCLLFDADNDGDLDLYIASGGIEFLPDSPDLSDRIYFNDGQGNLIKAESVLKRHDFKSTSCVANSDFDDDGDQDLAIGIRCRSREYGISDGGYILQNDGKGNFKDVTADIAPGLRNLGLITDMVWADIDIDKDEDLLVVGEYMPVSVFINREGKFENETETCGLKKTSGWWKTIKKADLNNDGNIDFVVGNHGLNSRFKASLEKPITLYVNDFDKNGNIDPILCRYNGDKSYPMILRQDLIRQFPFLKEKYPNYDSYKDQTIEDIFSREQIIESIKREIVTLSSSIIINNGDGTFGIKSLPVEAQFTNIYAIHVLDIDYDGNMDILLGGNQYGSKPEVGIYDGSYGITLMGDGEGNFRSLDYKDSGFFVKGQIRDIEGISINGKDYILVALNNNEMKIFLRNENLLNTMDVVKR